MYSPGLLAASGGLAAGDLVGVSVACELPQRRWCGIPRGLRIHNESSFSSLESPLRGSDISALQKTVDAQQLPTLPSRSHLFVGIGRCAEGRRGMFRRQSGLAVEMVERVYETPSINGGNGQ